MSENKNVYKICLVGNSGVGKSSLSHKLTTGQSNVIKDSTIGAAFSILITENSKYHIWDTAGQERYRSIGPMYYRSADIILLVFDLSNIESIESLHKWYLDIKKVNETAYLIVIGNKSDLPEINKMEKSEIDDILSKYGMSELYYIETSIFDNSVKLLETDIENISKNIKIDDKESISIKEHKVGYYEYASKTLESLWGYCSIL